MKRLITVLALGLLSSCAIVHQVIPDGLAICSTPLGLARSETYRIETVGSSTRVILQGVLSEGELSADASLCVFVQGKSK